MQGRIIARVVALAGVLGLIAAACTTSITGPAAVGISLTDFAITPGVSHVPADTPLRFEVSNDGKAPHSMAIVAGGTIYETPELAAGETSALEVPAIPSGTYNVYCTVAGHREAGMETALMVGEAAADAGVSAVSDLTPEEIDRAHREGIEAFPAETEGLGGQILEPEIVDGVNVFTLIPQAVRWEVSPGEFVDGFGNNAQIPGPEIRVRRGDDVRFIIRNELAESTSVHFHGLTVPNEMDGVPFITQDPIPPGGSFTHDFTIVDPPGTHMYHSHHNAVAQVGKGLLGALIIEPKSPSWDREYTMVLGDGPLGYTLNGKGFPATQPLVASSGETVLIRFMNEGLQLHPMHLHGVRFDVVARDGTPLASPYTLDTVTVAPGERYDVMFEVEDIHVGVWAFHCHVLTHAESEHGMHGMVTALVVS